MSAQSQRETWHAWLPPDRHDPRPLLTRAQLVARLQAAGVKAEEADLRYWEYEGILPRAVRQRHEGATRAVYPNWYITLVAALRALQSAGYGLHEIGPSLRVLFQHVGPMLAPQAFLEPMFLHHLSEELGGQVGGLADVPPEFEVALAEFTRRNWHIYGPERILRGEIRFYGDGPEPIIYPFDIVAESPEPGDVTLTHLPSN